MIKDTYDKVEEVLQSNYKKLLSCFYVWVDVNRYFDSPEPEDCKDFYDWPSLIYCVINHPQYTQHLFEFDLTT